MNKRAVLVGTGPSLSKAQISTINNCNLPVFGCNNVYQVCAVNVHLACNPEWWDYYYPRDPRLRSGLFDCWTWHRPTAEKYRSVRWIEGRWSDGLSTEKGVIHYGHSSGYQLLNLAFTQYGIREFVLVGYDLRYPAGYDGNKQEPGGDRHYFGEYPAGLQHWTRYGIGPDGELLGLLDCYRTIDPKQYGIRIINCSPGSALDFFETGDLREFVLT